LSYEELSNSDNILKSLACEKTSSIAPVRGWRMLSKTSLHESEIAELIRKTGTLGKVMNSNPELLKEILGEERSKTVKEEIKSIKINHMQMNEG